MRQNFQQDEPSRVWANLLFILAFSLWSLLLPLEFLVYTPQAYKVNRAFISSSQSNNSQQLNYWVNEITDFFKHKGSLGYQWRSHEIRHMTEVRGYYDAFATMLLVLPIILVLLKEKLSNALPRFLKISILVSLLFTGLVVSIFSAFWKAFHQLIFSNKDYLYHVGEVSYYLFPQRFFIHAILFIISFYIISHILLYFALIKTSRAQHITTN